MDTNSLRKLPINIDLLKVEERDLVKLGRVKTGEIFDNMGNFHVEGLFSTALFGNIGSEYRNRVFGYIDLGITILHPLIYYTVITLKSYYKQIAEGKVTAIFDEKTKSFIKSTSKEAKTGYNFFITHVAKLKFEKNESDQRSFLIDLFTKAIKEDKLTARYILVLPAGLRDYVVDPTGKPQEDEINTYYRKLIFQSNLIDSASVKKAPEVYDSVAAGLQTLSLELFIYIKSLLDGKHKLILGKWLTRKIFNSTRNVSSNGIEKVTNINDKNRLGYNDCYSGIHQYLRMLVPKSIYEIKGKYIRDIFIENSNHAFLTNAKTLKREEVLNTHIQKEYDLWTSADGIEKLISNLGSLDIRHMPVVLNKGKHYLGLVYRDKKYFKFFQDIDDVPAEFDRSKVTPVTLTEFFYMSIYHLSGKYPALVTRYPITGFGSIYPVYVKLLTTIDSEVLEELTPDWQPSGNIATSYPLTGHEFYNTTSVHYSRYDAMTLDTDGDTLSLTAVLSDEAIDEINALLNTKEYYVSSSGKLNFDPGTAVINSVLSFMTSQ